MKTKISYLCILLISITFWSCDTGDVNTNFKNYWASNALVRAQLRDKVKTVTTDDGNEVIEFDKKGNISKRITTWSSNVTTTSYTYGSNDELVEMKSVATGDYSSTSTTTYNYGSHGKYVTLFTFHIPEVGLVPNLSSVDDDNGTTNYVFEGDKLLIIRTGYDMSKDTSIMYYDGKYPSHSESEYDFNENMTFASNGMFLTYTEGFQSNGVRNTTRVYTYLKDDSYQLLDSQVETYVGNNGTTVTTTNYTYNENKDILSEVSDNNSTEFFDYVYDEKDNWTSRKRKYRYGDADWSEPQTETRVITYWD